MELVNCKTEGRESDCSVLMAEYRSFSETRGSVELIGLEGRSLVGWVDA